MKEIKVIELPPFSRKASKIFDASQKDELSSFIAANPEIGDIIPGTGGIRKVRWAAGGKGKRGGARILYFYFVKGSSAYLMACYKRMKNLIFRMPISRN